MWFLRATVVEALANLRVAPLRTALALLGIAIGSAAVIAILQIGLIAERQILEELENAGLNLIVATPAAAPEFEEGDPAQPLPRSTDIEARLESLPGIRRAALVKLHEQDVHIQGEETYLGIMGVTPAFVDIAGLTLEDGRFDALSLGAAPVGIAGSEVTRDLEREVDLQVGDHVRLGFDGYKIGGLLAPVDYNAMIGLSLNQSLLIPEPSLGRLTRDIEFWRVIMESMPEADKALLETEIEAVFLNDYGFEIDVEYADTMIAAHQSQQRSLTLLLAALGSVALIVGTVGVANVMLASVAERRREIGLRMAIGASPRDIKTLFLFEAIVLCLLGGLFGTLIGMISSNLYASISIADFTVSYEILAAALIIATVTGILSGYYPAHQSSRLDPVEALQGE